MTALPPTSDYILTRLYLKSVSYLTCLQNNTGSFKPYRLQSHVSRYVLSAIALLGHMIHGKLTSPTRKGFTRCRLVPLGILPDSTTMRDSILTHKLPPEYSGIWAFNRPAFSLGRYRMFTDCW
jgi:hypothetical protein